MTKPNQKPKKSLRVEADTHARLKAACGTTQKINGLADEILNESLDARAKKKGK